MAPWPIENLKRKKKKKERKKILKEFEKLARQESNILTSLHSFFLPESKRQICKWKFPPCIKRKQYIFVTWDREFWTKKSVQINLATFTPIFLVTSWPGTIPNPMPLRLVNIFTNLLFLCIQTIRPSCSGHHFGLLFSCEDPHVHVKFNKMYMLSAC